MRTDYTAKHASRFGRASLSQIEHFCQTAVVIPARGTDRRGVSRLYSLRNLAEIAVATQLVQQGVPVRAIYHVIDGLRNAWPLHAVSGELKRRVLVIECGEHSAEFGPFASRVYMSPEDVAAWLRQGHDGIIVNLPAILERLEQETGDTFDDAELREFIEASEANLLRREA